MFLQDKNIMVLFKLFLFILSPTYLIAGTLGGEPADFDPNSPPTFTITSAGAHTITGKLGSTPGDPQDKFIVTIPAGIHVQSISYDGPTINSYGDPLNSNQISGCGVVNYYSPDLDYTFSTAQENCDISFNLSTDFHTYAASWTFTINTIDITDPIASNQSSSNIAGYTARISAESNEGGNLYYVITTSSSTPSSIQIKAGTDHTGASAVKAGSSTCSANTLKSFDITNLDSDTQFYYYFVAEDSSSNQSNVLSGNFHTLAVPEIAITDSDSTAIVDGDNSPSTMESTDFGSISYKNQTKSFTYTITNSGTYSLTLSGSPKVALTNGTHFIVTSQPTSPINLGGGTSTFTIEFDPNDSGVFSDTVTIVNNDDDEGSYNFIIQGIGTNNTPVFEANLSDGSETISISEIFGGDIFDVNGSDGDGGATDGVLFSIASITDNGSGDGDGDVDDDNNAPFDINSSTGVISVADLDDIDYENSDGATSFILTIEIDDGLSVDNTATATVLVNIIDASNNPTNLLFTDLNSQAVDINVSSNDINISGLGEISPISISGANCKYSINNDGNYTDTNSTILNEQILTLKTTTSSSYRTAIDCNITIGGVTDTWSVTTTYPDMDNDGYKSNIDCNDNNPTVYPGATEIANNGRDDNCDGISLIDIDLDGFSEDDDCNDKDSLIHPGAIDIPNNGIDEDCSGADLVDATVLDTDADGYTPNNGDCDDNNPSINPSAMEVANNYTDENCDGLVLIVENSVENEDGTTTVAEFDIEDSVTSKDDEGNIFTEATAHTPEGDAVKIVVTTYPDGHSEYSIYLVDSDKKTTVVLELPGANTEVDADGNTKSSLSPTGFGGVEVVITTDNKGQSVSKYVVKDEEGNEGNFFSGDDTTPFPAGSSMRVYILDGKLHIETKAKLGAETTIVF